MDRAAPNFVGLAERFAVIVDGLCRLAAARMSARIPLGPTSTRPAIPLLMLLWTRLRRLPARFAALADAVAAGHQPRHRPPQLSARIASAGGPRQNLPAGQGWLVALLPYEAACFGGQLHTLLAEPDMRVLLDAAPAASRMLRPLCRMLGVPLPATPTRPTAGTADPARTGPAAHQAGRLPPAAGDAVTARKHPAPSAQTIRRPGWRSTA